MKKVASYLDKYDIETKVRLLTEHMEQQRQAGIQDFGWPEDCECHECGDTGTNPRDHAACWCDTGRKVQRRNEREASWPMYAPSIHVNARIKTHPSPEARKIGTDWITTDYPNNHGLVLSGSVGSGKTGLAVALAHIVHMQGKRVLIRTFTEILDDMRPSASNDHATAPSDMYKPHLLVLDDLGTQKMTEFVAERLFAIIDGRHHRHLPTIITTNLDMNQLRRTAGERAFSRIVESSRFATIVSSDLRMQNARLR